MPNVAKVSSANMAVSERRGWACSSYAERSQKSIPANNASAPRGQPYIIYILRRRESSLTAVFFLLFVYTSLHSFPHDSSSFHLPCKDTTSHPRNPTPLNSIEFYWISIEFYWISIETPLKSYGVELRVFETKYYESIVLFRGDRKRTRIPLTNLPASEPYSLNPCNPCSKPLCITVIKIFSAIPE